MNLKYLLRFTVTATLCYWLFHHYDISLGVLYSLLDNIAGLYFIAVLILEVLSILIQTYRWKLLIINENMLIPIHRLTFIYYIGMFFNNFSPGGFGGDISKIYDLSRFTNNKTVAVSSTLLARIINLVVSIVFALVIIMFFPAIIPDPRFKAAIAVLLSIALALLTIPLFIDITRIPLLNKTLKNRESLRSKLKSFFKTRHQYRNHPKKLIFSTFLAIIFVFVVITQVALLGKAIGLSIGLQYFFLFVPLILVASSLPISFNGLGVRENLFVYFFGLAGVDENNALLLGLLLLTIMIISSLIGGLLFLFKIQILFKKKSNE